MWGGKKGKRKFNGNKNKGQMKTAMQELIDELKLIEAYPMSPLVLRMANDLLEKEKEQIINACWYGHDIKHEYFNPIHYIDKTYPQNK